MASYANLRRIPPKHTLALSAGSTAIFGIPIPAPPKPHGDDGRLEGVSPDRCEVDPA